MLRQRRALHARKQHAPYVACLECVEIQLEEKRLARVAQGLPAYPEPTPWVPSPLHLIGQSAIGNVPGSERAPIPGPVNAMPTTSEPAPQQSPPQTVQKPAQVVMTGPEDLQALVGKVAPKGGK
jgi:hypothetical protein